MRAMSRRSTLAWMLVHVVFPLIPVPIEGVLRLLASDNQFRLDTFSASTVALTWGLICLFVNQSLCANGAETPEINDADEDDKRLACTLMNMFAIVCFVCFGACVTYSALIEHGHRDLVRAMGTLEALVFSVWPIPLTAVLMIQRSFRLRASLA
ncbi:MAG: hypothetical protein ABSD59_06910 [Terracidiphilus sp.]